MNPTLPIAAVALCAFPLAGVAQNTNDNDLSYTYLELDWETLDIDAVDDDQSIIEDFDDGDGWAASGSFAFTPNFFIFGGYSSTDSDVTFSSGDTPLITSSQDVERIDAGLGVNVPVALWSKPTDFVARAAYVDVDYGDFDFGATGDPDLEDLTDDSSDGWAADVRLRSQIASRLEASLGAAYLDIEEADGFSAVGNLLIELTPAFGINLEANVGDDVSYYLAGIRYSFDRF